MDGIKPFWHIIFLYENAWLRNESLIGYNWLYLLLSEKFVESEDLQSWWSKSNKQVENMYKKYYWETINNRNKPEHFFKTIYWSKNVHVANISTQSIWKMYTMLTEHFFLIPVQLCYVSASVPCKLHKKSIFSKSHMQQHYNMNILTMSSSWNRKTLVVEISPCEQQRLDTVTVRLSGMEHSHL